MNGLTIGKLAKQAGLTIDTVRFYESRGLLKEPERTASNYRIYPEEVVARLIFIKKAKKFGFSLNEIKELLGLQDNPAASKADVKKRTESKILDIRCRIKELTMIIKALEHLSEACDGHGPVSDCPILEALNVPEQKEHHHHTGGAS